jgi:polar amino acid transport system substrate-binding protein
MFPSNSEIALKSTSTSIAMNVLISSAHLTVGSDVTYPPQEYIDPVTHQAVGFDVDLASVLARRVHLQIQIKQDNFQNLIADLQDRRFDIVISAVGITPELKKEVNVIPYFVGGESLLVARGNPEHISTLANLCGLAVAAKRNTVEMQELQTMSATCQQNGRAALTIDMTNDAAGAAQLLQTGHVNAVYEDASQTDYAIKQQPGRFERGGQVIEPVLEGIVVRKEDNLTLHTLQVAFQQTQADGTYRSLINKWGLYSGDITSQAVITNLQ